MIKINSIIHKIFLPTYYSITILLFFSYIIRFGLGDYNYSEYFINYKTGFVRRGLTGEIFVSIPFFTRENVLLILLIINLVFILFNFFLLHKISKLLLLNRYKTLILLTHPALVGYYSWSYSNALKKDIMIVSFLLWVTYIFLKYFNLLNINEFVNKLILSLAIMPVLILIHEIVIYLSSVIYLIIFRKLYLETQFRKIIKNFMLKFVFAISLYLINCMLFLFFTLDKNNFDPVKSFQAASKFMPLNYSPFPPVTNNLSYYQNPVSLKVNNLQNLFTYSIAFLVIFISFLIFLNIRKMKNVISLFLLSSHVLIFAIIFSDWDRIIVFWSFVFFSTFCIISLENMPINSSIPKNANSAGLKQFMYGYSWAPALLLFLLIRVPTGNPAKISELSMIILFVQNVHEHLNL